MRAEAVTRNRISWLSLVGPDFDRRRARSGSAGIGQRGNRNNRRGSVPLCVPSLIVRERRAAFTVRLTTVVLLAAGDGFIAKRRGRFSFPLELGNETKMAVGGGAAILAFFGVEPKKVPACFALPVGSPATLRPLTPGPSPARGEGSRS